MWLVRVVLCCVGGAQNELAWRRHKERQALALADNGGAPPLCTRSAQRSGHPAGGQVLSTAQAFGCTFGTELIELGPLR